LRKHRVKASFFFTGTFYSKFKNTIELIKKDGHYLGAHSNEHLLYCDWRNRDSLLVTKQQFTEDLLANYHKMKRFGIDKSDAPFFLPPYEWYNDTIAGWTKQSGLQLISYTPGTLSHADYTTPSMKNYRSSDVILSSIKQHRSLKGFILLMHIGAGPERTDKFYDKLNELLTWLRQERYAVVALKDLLEH
jgi:endoglucanase